MVSYVFGGIPYTFPPEEFQALCFFHLLSLPELAEGAESLAVSPCVFKAGVKPSLPAITSEKTTCPITLLTPQQGPVRVFVLLWGSSLKFGQKWVIWCVMPGCALLLGRPAGLWEGNREGGTKTGSKERSVCNQEEAEWVSQRFRGGKVAEIWRKRYGRALIWGMLLKVWLP